MGWGHVCQQYREGITKHMPRRHKTRQKKGRGEGENGEGCVVCVQKLSHKRKNHTQPAMRMSHHQKTQGQGRGAKEKGRVGVGVVGHSRG